MSVPFKITNIDVFNTRFTVLLHPKDASNFLYFLRNTVRRDDLDEETVFSWCINHGIPVKAKYMKRAEYSLFENIQGYFYYRSFCRWTKENCPHHPDKDGFMVAAGGEVDHG